MNYKRYSRAKISTIKKSHRDREKLFNEIVKGKLINVSRKMLVNYQLGEHLGLSSRVPDDELRSMKNIVLSFNTLFSFAAELGGLPAVKGHYIAEKFAKTIEMSNSVQELIDIEINYIEYYSNPANRTEEIDGTISEKIINYIDMTFMYDLNIKTLSEKFHLNSSYMMRRFKKETGETIIYAINNRRIVEACDMLLNTNITISDIFFMVGYNSVQYFGRVFKKMTGSTPMEFKRIKNRI